MSSASIGVTSRYPARPRLPATLGCSHDISDGPPPLPADLTKGALAAPLVSEAQRREKLPTLGYLSNNSSESAVGSAFIQALRDLGWVDGQTIVIEARYTGGTLERTHQFARHFVAGVLTRQVSAVAVERPSDIREHDGASV
jgi:hypothetical protein